MDIEKFDPTVAELQAIVAETSGIMADDLTNKAQLRFVKENRLKLRDMRVKITKKGKELREEALAFQKAIIAKEKELIAVIEPEEDRLKAIEEEAARLEQIEIRKKALPVRLEALKALGIEATEEELLAMDDTQFVAFKNAKVEEQQQEERDRLNAERKAIEEEKAKIARDKELREAEDRARKETEERMQKEQEARIAREKQEEQDRIERERKEAEQLAKKESYRAFRAENGWTEEAKADFKEENIGKEIILWKKIASFSLD